MDKLEELQKRVRFLEETYIPDLHFNMLNLCRKWGKIDPDQCFSDIDEIIEKALGKYDNRITQADKVKNIIAFLFIIFGENEALYGEILDKSPYYLIEKFKRYIASDSIEHPWGLHPSIRRTCFDEYCSKWGLSLRNLDDKGISNE